jgi:heat shock protein HtpX
MEYIGLHNQIARNKWMSILLLIAFPGLVLFGIFAFLVLSFGNDIDQANLVFIDIAPYALAAVGIWFFIAYFIQERIIKMSTNSRPLERDENLRVYNLTENLCISVGMKMPKLFVIDCPSLNAFASGIDEKSYSITLTTGLTAELDNSELEGVIAHELTHIRNKDVQLLIISIIFVGIFAFVTEFLYNSLFNKRSRGGHIFFLIATVVSAVVYFFSILFKFALSRKREYLADAGAVELTKNARALASALRKISENSNLDVKNEDLKQAFIENSPENSNSFLSFFRELFNTHPPIKKRIEILENGL